MCRRWRPRRCSIWRRADLDYYDKIIDISQARFKAGDLAQIDLDRIELLRVQYESEIETAIVNLRTPRSSCCRLLDDRTPVDQFDVTGPFDFSAELKPLDDFRQAALRCAARPARGAAVDRAGADQPQAGHCQRLDRPDLRRLVHLQPVVQQPQCALRRWALSVSIPLRIFDRNQGEKQRTLIDIDRNQQLSDAARAQVFSDVDSAYELVRSNIALLKPYHDKYNDQATRVRDTVTYAYQRGGASLMDFLNAQSDYRQVQLAYLQLVGVYLTAASQLNLAVGREVIP